MVGLIIFLSFLILGEVTQISNVFTNIFYSIPLSSIFRNTSKFFFLIYVLILLLLIYNKNIKIPSILFFIASIPTLIIFLSGNVITSNITKSNIPSDYKILNNEELISKNDNILVYPPQYFPVYNFGNGIKQFGSSSLLELFIDGNFIQSRCVGCGNKRFELDLKNLTNFRLLNWVNKLEEYGVNKIIYDDNTDKNFYRNTISRLELEEELLIQGILVNTNQIGNIYIYNLILDSKKLSVCNSFWIDGDTNLLVEDCKNGEVYFTPSSNDYLQIQKVGKYHIYFVLFIINILIIIGGLQSYYKYRKKNA
ncbi:hypothetical protein GW846_02050 [Candidatus Gracilibacteria bacterium]|nr:hypothetical protein [Candidatus Gracilibacteria bacterium]